MNPIRRPVRKPDPAHPATPVEPRWVLTTLSLCLLWAFSTAAHAEPTAGVVTAGSATISANGAGNLVINQTSQNTTLNWQSFNIGTGESVRFVQPNSGAVAINRVVGSDPSRVLGNLSANGKVFLINPNGVLFGKEASVNVGGLVASTLDLTEADFAAGRYRFGGTGTGEVINLGTLRADDGGFIALLGNKVGNQGVISAPLGTVSLAAGAAVTLGVGTDGLLQVAVDKSAWNALASNGGLIQADGGAVYLSAQARDALLGTVVDHTGIIQANSLGQRNGRVVLDGGASGVVHAAGDVHAKGVSESTTGGTIVVSGDKLLVADRTRLDASGSAGGGGIYVGGGWQGADPTIRQASGVFVAQGATLDASATRKGNGGTVVAWSNVANLQSTTRVYGSLLARGGAQGGDGGRIETSGHWIDVAGLRADASAARGKAGQWLLDPSDLIVGGPVPPTDAAISGGAPVVFTSGAATPNVLNTDIETQLNLGTSVVLQAGAAGAGAGDVIFNASVAKTGGGGASLTANAVGSVVFNPGVTVGSSSGPLNVILNGPGGIVFGPGSDIVSNGGAITLTGSNVSGIPPLVGTGAATLTLNITGSASIDLGAPAGGVFLPVGFASGFSAINILGGSGNINVGAPMGFVDSVSIASGGNIVIAPGAGIATSKVGGTLALAGASFINNAGATGVFTTGGGGARWVIYSSDPAANSFGGLSSGNAAIWGQTFSSLAPGAAPAGNRYVFATPGVVTATGSGVVTKVYGQVIDVVGAVTFSGVPLSSAATYGNVFQDVLITDVFSVLPTLNSPGAPANAPVAGSPYPFTLSGGVANPGYSVSYVSNGRLFVTPAPLDVMAVADSRVYNGQSYAGGNGVTYNGLVAGDGPSALGGTLVYGGNSQGSVNAGQYVIVPSGLSSQNYAIRYVEALLTTKPKEVVVTGLTAANKDFDGTTIAIIRNWGAVNTGVGSETLVLNHGSANFSDAAIGNGKTVTADGYSLANGEHGGLASNYVLKSPIASTTANIVAAQRTQSLQSFQAAVNALTGSWGTEARRGSLNVDYSPLGLSASDLERGSQAAAGTTTATGTGSGTSPSASGNRLAGVSPSGGAQGPLGAQTQAGSGAAQGAGAGAGTSRFSSSGLSGVPKPSGRVAPAPAPRVPQEVFVKGAVRAALVGSTSSGAAVVATGAMRGQTARLVIAVAPGDGFVVALPRDLLARLGVRNASALEVSASGGPLPGWMTFDRANLRLSTPGVPQDGLPLTVRLQGAAGKVVEVNFQ